MWTNPTLTQVPPERPFSINKVFAPYHPEALLAAPDRPEPPPMTIKSYWIDRDAIVAGAVPGPRVSNQTEGKQSIAHGDVCYNSG